jgi:hypothetical protein
MNPASTPAARRQAMQLQRAIQIGRNNCWRETLSSSRDMHLSAADQLPSHHLANHSRAERAYSKLWMDQPNMQQQDDITDQAAIQCSSVQLPHSTKSQAMSSAATNPETSFQSLYASPRSTHRSGHKVPALPKSKDASNGSSGVQPCATSQQLAGGCHHQANPMLCTFSRCRGIALKRTLGPEAQAAWIPPCV